jgi:hypothetical protein
MGTEVAPQRWFAVCHLRIVPLATLPNEVECHVCGHRSDLAVLDVPTTEQLAVYLSMAVRSAVAFVVRSGRTNAFDFHVDATVRETAIAIMKAEGHEYPSDQFDDDVANLSDDHARSSLQRLTAELTPHGKQSFLHRMASIALADGPMSAREQHALVEVGVALGMSAPHINGVLAVAALQPEAA